MPIVPIAPRLGAALLVMVLVGCSSSKPTPAPAPGGVAASPGTVAAPTTGAGQPGAVTPAVISGSTKAPSRSDRQVLTRDEIRATVYTNAYDVIQALRGNWLRSRTAESFGTSSTVQVYLDQQRLSGVAELRGLSPVNIESIRFMDPLQASGRYGMDHGAGAILVTTAKKM